MSEKIKQHHLERGAYVYVRQSTPYQVRNHLEGKERQYSLAQRVKQLGFGKVIVIDEDLGRSACRVDVADSQTGHLGAPQAGGVDGHQQGTTFEMRRCGEYPCHFLPAEDQKKSLLLAWKGNVLQQKCPLPSLPIEETQRANDLVIA